jgi:eukaryotic-like serine/threonine-protein kinase
MRKLDCVPKEDLLAFQLGELPGRVATLISGHMDTCPDCASLAEKLETEVDACIGYLRQALGQTAPLAAFSAVEREEISSSRAATDAAGFPRQFGEYKLLGELGRGGVGVVYLARQSHPARIVALKMILAGSHAGAERRARFLAEADAIGRLRHPHIVQIHHVGECDGQLFLSLEWVPGPNLAMFLDGKPQDPVESAALVEKLARALHHAHASGIVHRDLKPANILLASGGLVSAGGDLSVPPAEPSLRAAVPKIADFGLAKQQERNLTATSAILGTPSYMAPEQAAGDNRLVGPAADIHALGAILFEMLTGQPPFRGASALETLEQVRTQEPLSPAQFRATIPLDLSTICLKCLRKEPDQRYASAAALADDLGRFLQGHPIWARPVGGLERAWRWCRRNPIVACLLVVVAVVLVSGVISTTVMWLEARANFEQGEVQRVQAEKNFQQAEHERRLAEKNLAQAETNFRETAAAIDKYFTKISEDRLLREPHMTELRKELLAEARLFYERLVAQRKNAPGMQREFAHAVFRLALIESVTGSMSKAQTLFEEALGLSTALGIDHRAEVGHRFEQAQCQYELGLVIFKQGRTQEAERYLTAALEAFIALSQPEPQEKCLYREADCYVILAEVAKVEGNLPRAIKLCGQGLAVCEQLVRGNNKDPHYQYRVAVARFRLGQMLIATNDPQAALAQLETCRGLVEPIAQRVSREQRRARELLAGTLGMLGSLYAGLNRVPEAEKAMLDAQVLWEQLTAADTALTSYQRDRAVNEHNLAVWYFRWQKQAEAERWCKRALELREQLHRQEPTVTMYIDDLALSYRQMAVLANKKKQLADVIAWNGKAVTLLEQSLKINPRSEEAKKLLAVTAAGKAGVLAQQGKHAESLADWDRSLLHGSSSNQTLYRSYRALSRVKAGDWQAAGTDLISGLQPPSGSDEIDLRLARAAALCAEAANLDATLSSTVGQEQTERFAGMAIQLLTRLQKAGAIQKTQVLDDLRTHPDWDSLRQRPAFQALFPK